MRPRFFIVGGPKCGTTSLAYYLSENPRIFMCSPKEPSFFNTDFSNRLTTSLDKYLRYFEVVPPGVVIAGEASVQYLASASAVPNIRSFDQDSLFIAIVRNPIDMAYSLHSQNMRNGTEPIADFGAAWHAQSHRIDGEGIPAMCREKKVLLYGFMCRLGEQVERLVQNAGRDHVHVIIFDDLEADPRRVYCDALRFLGVEDDGRTTFPKMNENAFVRNMLLKHLQRSMHETKQRWGITRGFGFLKWLDRRNRVIGLRPAMAPATRAELAEYFRSDIEKLSGLVGRPLGDKWLRIE